MANVTNLLNSFHETLAKTFSVASSPDTHLQMGWPGISLSDADFKALDSPSGPYDPSAAEETFSLLANIAPTCSAVRFENSGYEIDDLYQLLITGAVPQSADPTSLVTNPAYKMFSDAQFELAQCQKGSNRNPGLLYYPSRATPTDWYSEASAQHWPTFTLSSTQVKPARPDSPFIRLGGRQLLDKGVLKLAPAAQDVALIKRRLQDSVNLRVARFAARKPAVAAVHVKPLELARSRVLTARVGPPGAARALSVHDAEFVRRFTALNADPALKRNLLPTPAINRVRLLDDVTIDPGRYKMIAVKPLPLSSKILLQQLLDEQLTTAPVTDATEGFSLSFKYCLVNITRSWLKTALLNTRSWYMFATPAGEYSQGRLDNNPGMFPMLPTAFIVIRDLKISARWSPQDRQSLSQAKYFGPFDIGGRTLNQDTIEAKGLQVIAWLSRLTPMLPPLAAPAG